MAESEIQNLIERVREDERRKAEIEQLLRELRDAHSNDNVRHREIIDKLNYLERLLTASYNIQQATYTLLCGGQHEIMESGDEIRKELERRGLERNGKQIQERIAIRAESKGDLKVHVDGDVVGGNKDDKQTD